MIMFPQQLLPANEEGRLQALHSCEMLPVLEEEFFDELVALTAALFRLPIAHISLVDAEQVHYKARYGLPPLLPQPRAELFCAHVVKHGRTVVYQDLTATPQTCFDARAIQNGLASQVRFYAGAPLHLPGQYVIGTLCLVGLQAREFSAVEQVMLEAIADLASQAITVRCHCLATPALGSDTSWQKVQVQVRDEVYALGALVRYLAARYGTSVPVPEEILQPVHRRLHDLEAVLQEYYMPSGQDTSA